MSVPSSACTGTANSARDQPAFAPCQSTRTFSSAAKPSDTETA